MYISSRSSSPSPSESSVGGMSSNCIDCGAIEPPRPGIHPACVQPRPSALKMSVPYLLPFASITRPSPRLIATCAPSGRLAVMGSLPNLNSRAPGVRSASSTDISVPALATAWYCNHEPSVIVTPARAAAHSTSSEQSNVSGSGSSARTSNPITYRSPCCANAASRNVSRLRSSNCSGMARPLAKSPGVPPPKSSASDPGTTISPV